MPRVHPDNIKPDDKIFVGTRGRAYIIRGKRKYYITDKTYEYGRSYKPRPGAYNRFIQSQMNGITSKPQMGNTKRSSRNNRNGKGLSTQECEEHGNRSSSASIFDCQQALEPFRDGEYVRRNLNNERDFTSDLAA